MFKFVIIVLLTAVFGFLIFINNDIAVSSDAFMVSEKIPLKSQDNGKVKEIFVQPNQSITAGQLVAEIEIEQTINPDDLKKDTVLVSKKKLQKAEDNYTNSALMYKDGVISQQEYDNSLEKLISARESYNNAQNKPVVKPAVTKITKQIYASQDGIVNETFVDKGNNTVKDAPIILIETEKDKITAYFEPKFKDYLQAGRSVLIKPDKFKGKTFEGIIEQILPVSDDTEDNHRNLIPVSVIIKPASNTPNFDNAEHISVIIK